MAALTGLVPLMALLGLFGASTFAVMVVLGIGAVLRFLLAVVVLIVFSGLVEGLRGGIPGPIAPAPRVAPVVPQSFAPPAAPAPDLPMV